MATSVKDCGGDGGDVFVVLLLLTKNAKRNKNPCRTGFVFVFLKSEGTVGGGGGGEGGGGGGTGAKRVLEKLFGVIGQGSDCQTGCKQSQNRPQ